MARARSVACFLLVSVVFLAWCDARPIFAEEYRTWVDQTGKFRVEAKLHSADDTKVVLRTKDGRELAVPVSKLSDADQEFVKEASANPFAGGTPIAMPEKPKKEQEKKPERKPLPPPLERDAPKKTAAAPQADLWSKKADQVDELPVDGAEIFVGANLPLSPLERDPTPAPVKFQQMVVFLEKLDAYARVSPPIVIDPAKPTFAVSTHRVGNAVAEDHFGRIFLANAGEARPEIVLDLPETLVLFDHHVATDRSIAVVGVDSPSERGGDIVLLDGLATGKPQPLARWHLPEWEKPGFAPKVEFATMLDGDRALVQVNSNLYIWNLLSGKCLYQSENLRSGGELTLSGTGKYLVVPVGGGVRVVDTDSGELLGSVSIDTTLTPVAHFSPDGSRLALVAGSQFCVWDVVEGKELVADTVAGVTGKFLGWLGNDLLLTDLAGIIDPNLSMTLWRYSLPSGTKPLTISGGVAAIDKNGSSGTILMTMPIPHAPVAQVQKMLSRQRRRSHVDQAWHGGVAEDRNDYRRGSGRNEGGPRRGGQQCRLGR